MPGNLITGARSRFSLTGQLFAFATGVDVQEEIQYDPVDVLGDIRVKEWVPVAYRVNNFTANRFRSTTEGLKSLALFPKAGSNSAEHLLNILNQEDTVATLEDVPTSTTYAHLEGVRIGARGISVTPRGIVGINVSFVATVMRDETDQVL